MAQAPVSCPGYFRRIPEISAILLPMLAVGGLGKRFGDKWVFRSLSFKVEKGQCLVVVGRNGAGKSTLLKVVAGLLVADEGTFDIASFSYFALDLAPYANLTAREHLILAGQLRGIESEADYWLDYVGLSVRDKAAGKLSTGMRSRLKMALALQSRPFVLLLDEPGAGLDEEGRGLVARVVREQIASGAVVLATNDPQERRLATHELELLD